VARRRVLTAFLCLAGFAAGAGASERTWGLVGLGGSTLGASAPSQGIGGVLAAGAFAQWRLTGALSLRAELFPVQIYRQRDGQHAWTATGRTWVPATAGCVLARVHTGSGLPHVFFEAGAGPIYSWTRPVPPGGTHGNFFDQIGAGLALGGHGGGRWELLFRYVHISNANLGRGGSANNPGFSFLTAGVAWSRRG
jgi:hypothetical protein